MYSCARKVNVCIESTLVDLTHPDAHAVFDDRQLTLTTSMLSV